MRIVVIGQAAFGAKTLDALLEKGEHVVAVYTPPDGPKGRMDPLKEAAQAKDIGVFQPAGYKDEKAFQEYQSLRPDLTILAFVTDIIPARYFEAASIGAICYHPSILPVHRGASAINWAIIMGDKKTGLTIFWPDGGIDTGSILLQKEIDIGPDDTTGSLYFNHLFPMGIDAIVESVSLIKAGTAPRIPQDDSKATYEPPCDDKVAAIDWTRPAQQTYDLVRGCDPQPGAYASWKGDKLRFYSTQLSYEAAHGAAGSVVAIDQKGLHVAVPGGKLLVGKIRSSSSGKISALEFAEKHGLKAGDQLM
jgi:methionyl-tRNA formyltransferase